MEFKKLQKGSVHEVEEEILKQWKKEDILKQTIDNREGSSNFVFYDGPATANGMPGLHHMLAKFLKDTFCKYQTMKGHRVLRRVGWDTHGLPVEVQVEKKLGFNGKKDIEKYGIKEFNEECRKIVWENEEAFCNLTEQMGQFIDMKNNYVTYDNNYIETEWWILKKFFDEGLFYEGYKVSPYCTRCGTVLASHEVAQGYKEISVDTVIVPFKKKDEDVYFLVWTTTPWTLIANVALCVNPDEEYVKVESQGYQFILAKKLSHKVLGDDFKVLETYLGTDLEYMEYEQLIPSLEVDRKGFFVTNDSYVTMEDGTGIVHIAPAFGADDANVGRKYNLPYLNPVGEDGCYKEGLWKGRNVFEVDLDVIKYLKENDKLFKKQRMVHNYPHCWRCDTPLLYYAKKSYYLEITKLKDQLIENNKKINWYPSYVGEKRFGNWLENLNDWAISRQRYWGTPLPLWRCSCGHMEMIGSRKELVEKAIEDIDETIELHRPYVDEVHIKCPECGKVMERTTDVIDCWFDSGSMPFAQNHYPFEKKEVFEDQFPADFIAEGIDQTRGWFYSLLVISTFVKGVSPYKNVLVNDLLLDKNGQKMHKSRGNAINPFELINQYGADTIRYYLPSVSPVWTPIKFDEEGLKEIYSKYINTFKNTYSFFEMYANADHIDPREYDIPVSKRNKIDRWLISKLNRLIENVTKAYDEYDLTNVVRPITEFLNDDFSNWYIRSNRRRFWESELTEDKKCVYLTTYEVLLALTKLTAPITPFISEEIYQCLTNQKSVHLEDFPVCHKEQIDVEIEEKMEVVRTVCSLGRFAREDAKIKVRQPIQEVLLNKLYEDAIGDLKVMIEEELNVKKITYLSDLSSYMNYKIKPNYRVVGKQFGPKMKEFAEFLTTLTTEEILKIKDGSLEVTFDSEALVITNEMVDIQIEAKEGFYSASDNKIFVILNTTLTEELIEEGIAREIVRKVQSMRKEMDLVITDHIVITYDGNEKIEKVMNHYQDYIQNETLADEIKKEKMQTECFDFNGEEAKIQLEKK